MAERKAARTARRKAAGATFEALAASYLEEHAKRNKRLRAWKEDERKLSVEVLPVWGSRPAAEIRRADVRELLEKEGEGSGQRCANRTRALVSRGSSPSGWRKRACRIEPRLWRQTTLCRDATRESALGERASLPFGPSSIACNPRSPPRGAWSC